MKSCGGGIGDCSEPMGVESLKNWSLYGLNQWYNHNTGLFNFRIATYIGPKLMWYVTSICYLLYQETFCSLSNTESAAKQEGNGTDLPEYSIMCEVGDGRGGFTALVRVSGVWLQVNKNQ